MLSNKTIALVLASSRGDGEFALPGKGAPFTAILLRARIEEVHDQRQDSFVS